MKEQSKAAKRRFQDGAFLSRFFAGDGVDIGGKPDPLSQYIGTFPLMRSCRIWDLEDGDAQYMEGVADNMFDFVHASHCLEHMRDVVVALGNWLRILKPGGYMVITVPDEEMYELLSWPSRFNSDHKWSFSMQSVTPRLPCSINTLDLVSLFAMYAEPERITRNRDFFSPALAERKLDQTLTPVAECAIEIILRKRPQPEEAGVGMGTRRISGTFAVALARILRAAAPVVQVGEGVHGFTIPQATYMGWRADADFQAAFTKSAFSGQTALDQPRAWEIWRLAVEIARDKAVQGQVLMLGGDAARVRLLQTAFENRADALRYLADDDHSGWDSDTPSPLSLVIHSAIPDSQGDRDKEAPVSWRDADQVMDRCWPSLEAGGAMIFADYGMAWSGLDGLRKAVHSRSGQAGFRLITSVSGLAILFKSARS